MPTIFRLFGTLMLLFVNRFKFNSNSNFCLASSSSLSPSSSSSSSISNDELKEEEIPLLPESTGAEVRSFKLGESLKLDELGPIIINIDGTTRRIANWDTLTKQEKDSSFRLISARNKKRILKLQEQQKIEQNDDQIQESKEL